MIQLQNHHSLARCGLVTSMSVTWVMIREAIPPSHIKGSDDPQERHTARKTEGRKSKQKQQLQPSVLQVKTTKRLPSIKQVDTEAGLRRQGPAVAV